MSDWGWKMAAPKWSDFWLCPRCQEKTDRGDTVPLMCTRCLRELHERRREGRLLLIED